MGEAIQLDTQLRNYLLSVSVKESPILQEIRQYNATLNSSRLEIAPEQGQLLALLVRLIGASRILELGTYLGYSAIAMAQALPEQGQLLTCDINRKTLAQAQQFWQKANLDDKITAHLGAATDLLPILSEQKQQFDLIFIDADKANLITYYEQSLDLLRLRGLVIIDNTLWYGRVIDATDQSRATIAIRELNQAIVQDSRIDVSLIPIGDGMTLCYKH